MYSGMKQKTTTFIYTQNIKSSYIAATGFLDQDFIIIITEHSEAS